MTARYLLTVGGRDYEGTQIAGSYRSKSAAEVRSLIVPFAAEAAEFSLQDLGPLNPQRTWNVAYRPVKARYDPRDPSRSEILLAPDGWLPSGIGMVLFLAGAALCVFAWPAARRRKSNPPRS
jgi:membrane-associated phospholipid phosphatase